MMVSVFPETDAETGITDGAKFIKIVGVSVGWETLTNFDVPSRPVAAVAPDASGASSLAASLAAVGLVAISLF